MTGLPGDTAEKSRETAKAYDCPYPRLRADIPHFGDT